MKVAQEILMEPTNNLLEPITKEKPSHLLQG